MPNQSITSPAADPVATTELLQTAIDRVHAGGGGTVTIGAGRFVIGTIELRSHVHLHLGPGAILVASPEQKHYKPMALGGLYGGSQGSFLILAEDADGIGITGPGTIDGDALHWVDGFADAEGRYIRKRKDWRPRGIGLYHCTGVRLESFTIRDQAQWTIHLTACSDVLCQGLTIRNRLDMPNCDGIDPDRCRDVRIIGCHIEAGDDGIVLKNTKESANRWPGIEACEDITVHGCTIVSTSAALKIGTESHGDFRRIVFSGCTVRGSHRGVAIQLRDHGAIEDVIVSDCILQVRRFSEHWWGDAEPVAITAVPRDAGTKLGRISRIRLRNLLCRAENGVVIHGDPAGSIEDIAIDGLDLVVARSSKWPGGRRDLRPMRGAEHGGLEAGENPGLLARHVRGLSLRDVRVRFADSQPYYGAGLDAADCPDLAVADCSFQPGRPELPAERIADAGGAPAAPPAKRQRRAAAAAEPTAPAEDAAAPAARTPAADPGAADGLDRLTAFLRERGDISSFEAQAATGLSAATLRGHFKTLVEQGLVRTTGQRRGTRYVLVGGSAG